MKLETSNCQQEIIVEYRKNHNGKNVKIRIISQNVNCSCVPKFNRICSLKFAIIRFDVKEK